MRNLVAGSILGFSLAMLSAPSGAEAPSILPNGQSVFEITASSVVQKTADQITVDIPITASAATTAEARAKAQDKLGRVRGVLIAAGIPDAAIVQLPAASARVGFISNAEDDAPLPTNVGEAMRRLSVAQQRRNAFATLRVSLTEPRQLALIQPALDRLNETIEGVPKLALKDDGAAREEAITLAVAKARGDAESYAAATGFRIIRILKVSNAASPSNDPTGWTVFTDLMTGGGEPYKVAVQGRVVIEFLAEAK